MCVSWQMMHIKRERERERDGKCFNQESFVLQSAWHVSRNTFGDLFEFLFLICCSAT